MHCGLQAVWRSGKPQVSLADGVTTKLRLKPNSKVLLSPLEEEEDSKQSWIIPMDGVTELGYKFGLERGTVLAL